MSDEKTTAEQPESAEPGEELSKFTKLARALFRVDKRDVPKHQPKRRSSKQITPEQS